MNCAIIGSLEWRGTTEDGDCGPPVRWGELVAGNCATLAPAAPSECLLTGIDVVEDGPITAAMCGVVQAARFVRGNTNLADGMDHDVGYLSKSMS